MIIRNVFGQIKTFKSTHFINATRPITFQLKQDWSAWNRKSRQQIRAKSNQQNYSSANNNRSRINFGFGFGVVFLAGFLWYHDEINKKVSKSLNNLLPKCYAAIPTSTTKKSGNREKFNFIAEVVNVSAPAVVYIEVKDTRRYDYTTKAPLTASNGSGFIVDSNGLILTNAHVVINKPHTFVQVKLLDGRVFIGTVEDVDSSSDLATVRIKCKNLPTMQLGNSSDLKAGEWVVALGSPLALSNTVTAGVVSSTQRPSQELGLTGKKQKTCYILAYFEFVFNLIAGRNINYIQTDAAITFGNSGGPLVNLDGEAIGINSMKVTAGISFAIPIDYAKAFLQKGIERRERGAKGDGIGPIRRYMGITMLTLSDDILRELRERRHFVSDEVKSGVLVWKVIIGSPGHV